MNSRSFAGNFSIQLLGRVGTVLLGLIVVAILTRSLGAEQFGEYTTAMTFLQMFGVVVDFGLTLTLVIMISEKGADEDKLVSNIFTLRMISGAILFALAPIAVLALPWSNAVQQGVLVGAVAYVLMGGAMVLIGVFQKHRSMWRVALGELVNRSVLLAAIALFAYLDLGVVWMIGASILANGVWLFAMKRFAKPFLNLTFQVDWHTWKKIISRSWPIAISIFFNLLYLKGDILFLAYFREQTEVGLYGVAYRIIDVLTALPVLFMGLLLPSAVKLWTSGDKEGFRKQVARTFDIFMIAVIPIMIGAQAISGELIELIAGAGYQESAAVLQLLILATIGVFLGALYGHLVVALNKQKPMVWGYLAVAVISVTGYLWLIPIYGMWGAVWVTLVSEALIATITFIVVYKVSKALPNLIVTFKAIVAAVVMYVVLITIPDVHVIFDLLIASVTYFAVLLAIKGITTKDLKMFLPKAS